MYLKSSYFVKILKGIIPLGLLVYLTYLVYADWGLAFKYFQELNILILFLSFPVFVAIYPEGALCWAMILRLLKLKTPLFKVLSVWIISNTSRYIPGTIWQYLSRVVLAEKVLKINKTQSTGATILEVFFTLVAAVLSSLFALKHFGVTGHNFIYLLSFIVLIVFVFYSRIFRFMLILLGKVSKKSFDVNNFEFSLSESLQILPVFVLNFLINGIAIYILILSFNVNLPFSDIWVISGFYAFSWLLGYLSFFAPGGLGVTEVSLAYFLSLLIPMELSFIITLFYRLLLTLSELLVFLFFLNNKNIKKILKNEH